ncbi:Hypothetical protein CINCED_3A019227 [Cinara cedri]|uniref:Uncharacterized protein n=1 Tax=Cinara cedri TaxID=506608 RepID=A0A5E4MER6_9HEMI|nr:Hypothetical protein CINCED_3A019227 [Cinara cedri]
MDCKVAETILLFKNLILDIMEAKQDIPKILKKFFNLLKHSKFGTIKDIKLFDSKLKEFHKKEVTPEKIKLFSNDSFAEFIIHTFQKTSCEKLFKDFDKQNTAIITAVGANVPLSLVPPADLSTLAILLPTMLSATNTKCMLVSFCKSSRRIKYFGYYKNHEKVEALKSYLSKRLVTYEHFRDRFFKKKKKSYLRQDYCDRLMNHIMSKSTISSAQRIISGIINLLVPIPGFSFVSNMATFSYNYPNTISMNLEVKLWVKNCKDKFDKKK